MCGSKWYSSFGLSSNRGSTTLTPTSRRGWCKIVEQLLFNYADVQESLLGVLIDMRCDIEVALLKLTGPEQELAYSVMSQGEGALLSGAALEPGEWHSVVHKLAYILNVEGTG
jgi:hypothetical protein